MHQIHFLQQRSDYRVNNREREPVRSVPQHLLLQAHPGLDRFLIYFPWDRAGRANYYSWLAAKLGIARSPSLSARFSSHNIVLNALLMIYAFICAIFQSCPRYRNFFSSHHKHHEFDRKEKSHACVCSDIIFQLIISKYVFISFFLFL